MNTPLPLFDHAGASAPSSSSPSNAEFMSPFTWAGKIENPPFGDNAVAAAFNRWVWKYDIARWVRARGIRYQIRVENNLLVMHVKLSCGCSADVDIKPRHLPLGRDDWREIVVGAFRAARNELRKHCPGV